MTFSDLNLTHVMRHVLQMARSTNFKLGVRMEDDDPHRPQAPWPPRSKVKVAFVCPSIITYIANNSRTQRSSVPKFGRKVPYLRCDSHTSFKVRRLKVRVTRPINAHRPPYLPNGKAYELRTWYTDRGRWPASATGSMTSQVIPRVRQTTIGDHAFYESASLVLHVKQFVIVNTECTFVACI